MKKLLLTSSAKKTLHFISQITTNLKNKDIVFISTAGNVYKKTPWIDESKKSFANLNLNFRELDLSKISPDNIEKTIGKPDILFVSGGNSVYLLEQAQKSGFLEYAVELVENNTIYIGSSAGSILAGPDLKLETFSDDRKEPTKLDNYKGLELVDFIVQPHWGPNSELMDEYIDIADKLIKSPYPILTLNNDQAVIVTDEKFQIVSN